MAAHRIMVALYGTHPRHFGVLSRLRRRAEWLLPLIVVLVLVGALIVLSTTAVAPFIYTLF
ncbi:MAG: DUF5989 family protein [Bacteroidota bacterium]